MNKRLIIAIMLPLFFLSHVVLGGGGEVTKILEEVKRAQESIEDLTAEVKQVRTSALTKGEVISRGKLIFKNPDQIRLEMYAPDPSITILKGGMLMIYYPQERVAQRYDLARNPAMARWLLLFKDPIEGLGNKVWLEERHEGEVILGIDPQDATGVFQKVLIAIDTSNWLLRRIEWEQRGGGRTTISYEDIKINAGVGSDAFQLRLPPDVEVIEPLRHR